MILLFSKPSASASQMNGLSFSLHFGTWPNNGYVFFQIEASGGEALTYGGDVSKEADVEAMMKKVSNILLCLLTRLF